MLIQARHCSAGIAIAQCMLHRNDSVGFTMLRTEPDAGCTTTQVTHARDGSGVHLLRLRDNWAYVRSSDAEGYVQACYLWSV